MPFSHLTQRLVRSAVALATAGGFVVAGCAWSGAGEAPLRTSQPTAEVIEAPGVDRIEQRPGWSQRLFDLRAGTEGVSAATLTTRLRTPSPIERELFLIVEECSQRWTAAPAGDTYDCGGATQTRIARRPAVGDAITLDGLRLGPGGVAYLRATLTVGADAAPGQSATLDYTFTTA